MLYYLSKSFQFWGIKNDRLEVVRTPQTPFPPPLKKSKQGYLTYTPSLYSTPLYSLFIQISYKGYQRGMVLLGYFSFE